MVYLLRHGQSEWNLQKRFNGITETCLTEEGLAQARRQAETLRDVHFALCLSSPQKRARQAAEILCPGKVIQDGRLAEIDCGEFEGTPETPESMRQFWQAVMQGEKGTESFADFLARSESFCEMVRAEHGDKTVLVVTHAANARVLNYCFGGKPQGYDFGKAVAQNGEVLIFE